MNEEQKEVNRKTVEVNFSISDDYLIVQTLSNTRNFSSDEHKADIVAFQNFAWEKSEQLYRLLTGREEFTSLLASGTNLSEITKELEVYMSNLKSSRQYQVILNQTQEYLTFCKKEWEENLEKSSQVIKELTQFDLDKKFDVLITHPSLANGRYHGNNVIGWGHHEEWSNYAVVYLWHEILHSFFQPGQLDHALIQLIADQELRVRLNGGSYPPFIGHEELLLLMEKLLPSWQEYLKEPNKNFESFRDKIRQN